MRKATGKEILLLGGLTENVYTGQFAKRLQRDDLRLSEQRLKTNETRLPGTFVTGTWPIDTCFATVWGGLQEHGHTVPICQYWRPSVLRTGLYLDLTHWGHLP